MVSSFVNSPTALSQGQVKDFLEMLEERADITALGSTSKRQFKVFTFKALKFQFLIFRNQSHTHNRVSLATPLSSFTAIDPSTIPPTLLS